MDEFSFDDIEARLEESRILGAELLGLHIGSRPKRKLLPKLRDARQANDVEQYANLLDESGMHLMHEGRFYSATRALRLSLQV